MQHRKTVALIEPQAQNVDPHTQKFILSRYAEKHGMRIDLIIGERAPELGAAGAPEHRNLLNEIRAGGVDRVLVLAEVKHAVPAELQAECRKQHVKLELVDVQQEGGLA
jgi:hypothetical protein